MLQVPSRKAALGAADEPKHTEDDSRRAMISESRSESESDLMSVFREDLGLVRRPSHEPPGHVHNSVEALLEFRSVVMRSRGFDRSPSFKRGQNRRVEHLLQIMLSES